MVEDLYIRGVIEMSETYDVVIVGSGPAGYTAALYAARANLDVLVFQGFEVGGQLMLTSDVERVDLSERPFKLWAEGEQEPVLARAIVIATGAKAKWLGLPGEQRLMGRGVSGCATCDGFFFKDKKVAVVGGGDTAMEEATFLSKFASEVILIHRRDQFRASKIMLDRARNNPKITFLTDMVVQDILGDEGVEGIRVKNAKTGEEREIELDGFFAAIGHAPATDLFKDQVEMDEAGYIRQKEHTMTSVPGVFAAGDVSDKRYRQAVTAAGDGCRAAIDAERWLEDQGEAEHAEDPAVWIAEKEMQEDPSQPVG